MATTAEQWQRIKADPERLEAERTRHRVWAQANRDKVRARHREWRQANKGKTAEYNRKYQGSPKGKATIRTWLVNNRDRHNADGKRWAMANPEKRREISKRSYKKRIQARGRSLAKYGMTQDMYLAMAWEQDFRCYICGKHESDLHWKGLCIDHSPVTGKVRHLLCMHCNVRVGFAESPVYQGYIQRSQYTDVSSTAEYST